jgi:capsular exopolysaccharide synthesis family protein
MGKVYEALRKARIDGKPTGWSSVSVDSSKHDSKRNGNGDHKLDFMDYSLNAADALAIEQRNRETADAEAARKALVQPAREAFLDMAQIAPQLISFNGVNTNAVEGYNKLAIALISSACERPVKRVLVASAQPGEGRTSITLNLACALAQAQRRVLVVDTDLHSPSLLRLLGLNAEIGLTDALSQGLAAGAALIRVQPFGFDLLPVREQVKSAADLLSSLSFERFLELFDPDYDFILFDSSPLLTVADSSLLIRQTDATVLVIRSGKTTSGEIGRAISRLSQEKILGVVLNRADRAAIAS